jgi:hypothetical protein
VSFPLGGALFLAAWEFSTLRMTFVLGARLRAVKRLEADPDSDQPKADDPDERRVPVLWAEVIVSAVCGLAGLAIGLSWAVSWAIAQ